MFIIGIVGGVASGKSLVAKQLEACGAGILDGDAAGHEVLEQEEVKRAIRRRWGDAVFSEDRIDRSAVARIVFDPSAEGKAELDFLERLTHPRIEQVLNRESEAMAARGTPAAVLDAAVMIKAGWNRLCDKVLFIDAPREIRQQRAKLRGWSEEQFRQRESAQEPLEQKRAAADVVIDNSGTPEATRAQIERFWQDTVDRRSSL